MSGANGTLFGKRSINEHPRAAATALSVVFRWRLRTGRIGMALLVDLAFFLE